MDKTRIAVDIFDKFAVGYQDKYMDISLYQDFLDLFCSAVQKKNAAVLDIACGPGNLSKYLLEKRPDFRLLGIDLSPKMIELARASNPSAEFRIMDVRDVERLGGKYDAIACGFGLPYLSKAEAFQLIREAAALLYPRGVFYLSTMEDAYEKSGFTAPSSGGEAQLFIYYHEAGYLREALRQSGFQLLRLSRKIYRAKSGEIVRDLILLARKKVD